jgi:two-component system LytT family response regulator
MKMTCLIVDDEPAARKGLAADLTDIGYLEMIGSAVNAFEALELIHHYSPDLVFLDIEMPGMSGLDFLKLLKIKPIIIFTTAYQQYALNGY